MLYEVGFGSQKKLGDEVVIQPEEWVVKFINKRLRDICYGSGADDFIVYLSGHGNFRTSVATIAPYKGNRAGFQKPVYHDFIYNYLCRNYDPVISVDMEADDELGIALTHDTDNILCSIDKDLDMIAGHHYNWRKREVYEVTPDEADIWFWKQMLMGDVADNIKGIRGIGPKRADQALEGLDRKGRCETVLNMFSNQHQDFGLEAFNETGKLLWILRTPEDDFSFDWYMENYAKEAEEEVHGEVQEPVRGGCSQEADEV